MQLTMEEADTLARAIQRYGQAEHAMARALFAPGTDPLGVADGCDKALTDVHRLLQLGMLGERLPEDASPHVLDPTMSVIQNTIVSQQTALYDQRQEIERLRTQLTDRQP